MLQAVQTAKQAADSRTGHQSSLAWRLEARLSFSQAEPDGEFCEAKLVRSVPKGPILRHQSSLSPHLTQTSEALRLLIIQPVIMTLRIHLFPFRTQKLSSAVLKILGGKLPGKISRRRHQTLFIRTGFFLLSGSIWRLSAGIVMVLRNFLTASAILVKNTTGGIL